MNTLKSWLKHLTAKDPNIRYAKQIEQGKIKLVEIGQMNRWERVRFVWREHQIIHSILPITFAILTGLIFFQAHEYLETTNCEGMFGISKSVLSITNLVFFLVMITVSCWLIYRYEVRLNKKEWRLKHWQNFKSYALYQRNTPFRRQYKRVSFIAFLALALLCFFMFVYLGIDAVIDYGGWADMNRALIEQCERQAINQNESPTP